MFLEEQLTLILDEVAGQVFPDLNFDSGRVFPILADLPEGVSTVAQTVIKKAGQAFMQGRGSNQIPVVEASANRDGYPVQFFAACYPLSFQDEQAANFARSNTTGGGGTLVLDSERELTEATFRVLAERTNNLYAFGRSGIELNSTSVVTVPGFLNNPNVFMSPTVLDPNVATAAEIYKWFFDQVRLVTRNSSFAFRPNSVLVPDEFYTYLNARLLDDNVSIYSQLMASGQFEEIIPSYECQQEMLALNGIPNDGVDLAVFYIKDRRYVKAHTSLPAIAPESRWPQEGLTRLVPIYVYATPTIISQPLSMGYARVARPV